MDKELEKKARKQHKREEKVRHKNQVKQGFGKAQHSVEAIDAKRQIGRTNLLILAGIVLLGAAFIFSNM